MWAYRQELHRLLDDKCTSKSGDQTAIFHLGEEVCISFLFYGCISFLLVYFLPWRKMLSTWASYKPLYRCLTGGQGSHPMGNLCGIVSPDGQSVWCGMQHRHIIPHMLIISHCKMALHVLMLIYQWHHYIVAWFNVGYIGVFPYA